MTPLNPFSFWSTVMRPYCESARPVTGSLIKAVDQLYQDWKGLFNGVTELPLSRKPYLLDDNGVPLSAGIIQIVDYANEADEKTLLRDWMEIQQCLKIAKTDFYKRLTDMDGLNYFGLGRKNPASVHGKQESQPATNATVPLGSGRQ